jgi:mortality factor 4-like protein 1
LQEELYNSKPAVRIPVADALKSILVDDWENVTKNGQLAHVPSLFSVHKILEEYKIQETPKRPQTTASLELLDEVIAGLKEYFNRSLGRILLYKYERAQYNEIINRMAKSSDDLFGRKLTDIYGAEHLLRLFGILISLSDVSAFWLT